jgi:uncharacterized protein YjbJ (UPF0337 family)
MTQRDSNESKYRDWPNVSKRLRERWSDLTDDDLAAISGDRERLIKVLEERYPRTREVIEREVAEFDESVVDKAASDPDVEV